MSISAIDPPTEISTSLVTISDEEASVLAFFTSEEGAGRQTVLYRIKREVEEFQKVYRDPSERKDREEIKAFARRLVKTRTGIEALGKSLADRLKALPKRNDENRRIIRTAIETFEVEVLAPVSLWEAEEKFRIDCHLQNVKDIQSLGDAVGRQSEELRNFIADLGKMKIDETQEEFADDYRIARDTALAKLRTALAAAEQHERDQAELAALRAAQAERDAKERAERETQERIAREHQAAIAEAEAKQRKAERDALMAKFEAEQAERRRLEAEAKAKRDAEIAELAKKAEDEKRARNKAHRARVNNVAADALANVMEECLDNGLPSLGEIARAIIAAIAKGEIPAITITY